MVVRDQHPSTSQPCRASSRGHYPHLPFPILCWKLQPPHRGADRKDHVILPLPLQQGKIQSLSTSFTGGLVLCSGCRAISTHSHFAASSSWQRGTAAPFGALFPSAATPRFARAPLSAPLILCHPQSKCEGKGTCHGLS